jgi:hypothetical protein
MNLNNPMDGSNANIKFLSHDLAQLIFGNDVSIITSKLESIKIA